MNTRFKKVAKWTSISCVAGVVAFAVVQACTASQQLPVTRAACYAAADHQAQLETDKLCPADAGVFEKCPSKALIMQHLQAAQEACK